MEYFMTLDNDNTNYSRLIRWVSIPHTGVDDSLGLQFRGEFSSHFHRPVS